MTELYLARHGETVENIERVLQGHMPGQLTELGRRQAEALRDRLAQSGTRFDLILASDLKRTMDTAQIVNQALRLPLVPCALLRERDWGSLTGLPIGTFDADHAPQDVESVEQMHRRARQLLKYIGEHYADRTVLAISHGLFGRCLMAEMQGCTIAEVERMQNCEVRRLIIE